MKYSDISIYSIILIYPSSQIDGSEGQEKEVVLEELMMVRVISAETLLITNFLKFHPLGGSTDLFNLPQSSAKQDRPGVCFTMTVNPLRSKTGKFLSSDLTSPFSKDLRHWPEGYSMNMVKSYKEAKIEY